MTDDKRIVEVNGVKIEVDLRTAKRVDQFKVGDAVKVLAKEYGERYESHFGMIVGFDEFKSLPTIIVAYLKPSSWDSPLKFAYINAKSENVEIVSHDPNDIGVEKADVLESFDRELNKKKQELHDIERKKAYFENMFGRYFETIEAQSAG
jgi:hypothetical protein